MSFWYQKYIASKRKNEIYSIIDNTMEKVSKDPNIEELNKLIEESKKISGVNVDKTLQNKADKIIADYYTGGINIHTHTGNPVSTSEWLKEIIKNMKNV